MQNILLAVVLLITSGCQPTVEERRKTYRDIAIYDLQVLDEQGRVMSTDNACFLTGQSYQLIAKVLVPTERTGGDPFKAFFRLTPFDATGRAERDMTVLTNATHDHGNVFTLQTTIKVVGRQQEIAVAEVFAPEHYFHRVYRSRR